MNIILVKHGCSREYAFQVPDCLVPYIKKNEMVAVKTTRGLDVGMTTTDVFTGDGAKDIAIKLGAYEPIQYVVGFIPKQLKDTIRNELLAEIMNFCHTKSASQDLPF